MVILYAFLILTVLGVILGVGLNYADKKLSIKKDEKLVQLESLLAGANCGSCGYAGCADYAQAVFEGKAKPGLCTPAGQSVADKMAQIMGIEADKVERKVAYVFCDSGCNDGVKEFDYKGIDDCNAAAMLFNGSNGCKEGCLHMLSCQKVCSNDAIQLVDGNVMVDRTKCIGCGKCVSVCPHSVIKLIPYDLPYAVKCNSKAKGGDVRKVCTKGCIGCKICETKFPESGFVVTDNLAGVSGNYKVEDMKAAAEVCPRKIIAEVK